MKRQTTLADLVNELKDQNLRKKDFVVPANLLSMENGMLVVNNYNSNDDLAKLLNEIGIKSEGDNKLILDCLPILHQNLSDKCDIPRKYYNRIQGLSDTTLIDTNVTHWLKSMKGNIFLRTFINKEENQGFGRAILSDRYNVLDNFDVLLATLEAVKSSGLNLKIEDNGCDLSESKMYVRFIAPDIEIKAPDLLKNYKNPKGNGGSGVGDGIITGFVVTNSELGQGSFSISPRAVVLKCQNGMVFKNDAFGKVHLGSKMEQYSQIDWSEETKRKNYELIQAQVKDAVKQFTSEDYLAKKISELNNFAEEELKHPIETIKNVSKFLAITEEKEKSILDFFMRGGDFSPMGVSQALTFYAHETNDADEAHDMESVAIDILPKIKEMDKPIVSKSVKTQIALN
jgi:hypothetical protein